MIEESERDAGRFRAGRARNGETPKASLTSARAAGDAPESDRHPARSLLSCQQPGKLDREQPDYLTSELLFWRSAAFTDCGEAGSCSTVSCWPSHRRASSTVSPSRHSSASLCPPALPPLLSPAPPPLAP